MKDKQHIKLEQAKPDMTLAQDLLDIEGHCLMTTDTLLTEDKLASLQRRGILNLVVWGAKALSPQEIAEQRTAAQAQLDQRFRQMEQEPTMQTLKAVLLAHRLEGLE